MQATIRYLYAVVFTLEYILCSLTQIYTTFNFPCDIKKGTIDNLLFNITNNQFILLICDKYTENTFYFD